MVLWQRMASGVWWEVFGTCLGYGIEFLGNPLENRLRNMALWIGCLYLFVQYWYSNLHNYNSNTCMYIYNYSIQYTYNNRMDI
jgi:hypothetical protein